MKLLVIIVCLHGLVISQRLEQIFSFSNSQSFAPYHSQTKNSCNNLCANTFPKAEDEIYDEFSKKNVPPFEEELIPSSENNNNVTFSPEIEKQEKEERPQLAAMILGANLAQDYCNYRGLNCRHWQQATRYFKSENGACYKQRACNTEGSSSNYQCEKNCY